jgi:radical SAM superfamily enzyme with C-terminal helix-hairpin-helix motif
MVGAFGALAAGMTWRSVGFRPAGRTLLRSLEAEGQERTIAGMALVQAGERSVELIEDDLDTHGASKIIVQILADIGGTHARSVLERIGEAEGEVGALARDLAQQMDN